jgi:AraC-like DNA-binding protein/mannose-6-phosphate isomerase-like protein (cupin superfamily)
MTALNRVQQAIRRNSGPFLFEDMQEDPHALDRLDIQFRWGHYGIQLLRCHLTSFPPAHVVPFHKHHNYEFHFIPRGRGTVTLVNGTFPVHSGMFYLTGPQVMHQQEADPQEDMYELCLHLEILPLEDGHCANGQVEQHPHTDNPLRLSTPDHAHTDNPLRLSDPDSRRDNPLRLSEPGNTSWGEQWEIAEAEACIQQLNQMPATPTLDLFNAMHWFLSAHIAWRDQELGAFTTIRQSVIQILLRAARAYGSAHSVHVRPIIPARDMNIYRYRLATQYIRDNYARPLVLEEVAESLNISARQLQRILYDHAQDTFSGYLERYRLAQVCEALTYSEQTIGQIAVAHGFSSSSYLHTVFKKRLGLTPLEYRQQQRRNGLIRTPDALSFHPLR